MGGPAGFEDMSDARFGPMTSRVWLRLVALLALLALLAAACGSSSTGQAASGEAGGVEQGDGDGAAGTHPPSHLAGSVGAWDTD